MRSTAAAEPARMIRTGEMVAMFAEVPQPQLAGRRAVSLSLALCLAVLLCGSVARAQSVAFINPGKSDEIYWVTATQAMQAAAHSLGMTFEVQYAQREPLKTLDIAREMVARPAASGPTISWSRTTIRWPTGCWRSSTLPA